MTFGDFLERFAIDVIVHNLSAFGRKLFGNGKTEPFRCTTKDDGATAMAL